MTYFIICYLSSVLCYIFMHKLSLNHNMSQTERSEGLESHKFKNGTPTLGGIVFIVIPIVILPFFVGVNINVLSVMLCGIGFLLVGFFDDFKIIVKKDNNGLSPKKRLILEIIISMAILILLFNKTKEIKIFNYEFKVPVIIFFLLIFFIVGSANSFNLTDGIDLLLSSLSIIILLGLFVISYKQHNKEIEAFIILIIISISSFYFLNFPKALIFMGDTGSLSLGALSAVISIILKEEVLFIIMAFPLIFETISDILQITYFKRTKGKRLFKMAPFHHHLELRGYSEKMIVVIFSFIEVIFTIIALFIGGYL